MTLAEPFALSLVQQHRGRSGCVSAAREQAAREWLHVHARDDDDDRRLDSRARQMMIRTVEFSRADGHVRVFEHARSLHSHQHAPPV